MSLFEKEKKNCPFFFLFVTAMLLLKFMWLFSFVFGVVYVNIND